MHGSNYDYDINNNYSDYINNEYNTIITIISCLREYSMACKSNSISV